jgi:hypothetical protein
MVNKRIASCLFLSIQNGTSTALICNNIFAGSGTHLNGTASSMTNNVATPDIQSLQFTDELNYDYHLQAGSPAIDYGISIGPAGNFSLLADSSYEHPCGLSLRYIANSAIDAGAYEYGVYSFSETLTTAAPTIWPNPVKGMLYTNIAAYEIRSIRLIGANGGVAFFQGVLQCTQSCGTSSRYLFAQHLQDQRQIDFN